MSSWSLVDVAEIVHCLKCSGPYSITTVHGGLYYVTPPV